MDNLDKLSTHVKATAKAKNFTASFYRFIRILNRRIELPKTVFTNEIKTTVYDSEAHLIPYMIPINGTLAIDVGANRGQWTEYLSEKGINVVAFEPNPLEALFLKRRFRTKSNVIVMPTALGAKPCKMLLHLHRGSGHNSLKHKGKDYTGKSIEVQVKTVDSYNFKKLGLIKIDTEGYELPVLLGSIETIKRFNPRLVIEVHEPYAQQQKMICKMISTLGYKWILKYKKNRGKPHIIADKKMM